MAIARMARVGALLWLIGPVSGCTVTGVAAPAGDAAHHGQSLQYIGEPGYNAP